MSAIKVVNETDSVHYAASMNSSAYDFHLGIILKSAILHLAGFRRRFALSSHTFQLEKLIKAAVDSMR